MRACFVIGLAVACATGAYSLSFAQVQTLLPLADARPIPRDGVYMAGDNIEFALDHFGDRIRLRFAGSDEVFYLSSEAAPLGDRVLKYDSGDLALRVTGWGGVTLYKPPDKTGIPAEYSDATLKIESPAPAGDGRRFAAGLAKEVESRSDFAIGFATNWDKLAGSDALKTLAWDAMRNASYALEQAAAGPAHNAVSDGLHIVRIVEGDRVAADVRRGILTVTIVPKLGPAARPSSLQISHALASAFSRP